ncbi:MAG: tetratricopeptide repeat protein [Anaerolinea sp.]|nr:tetratricopeptide repeat protein [Anaerolinea sp.]
MSDDRPSPDDFLARFQRKVAANAAAWQAFLQEEGNDPAALERELANLTKAAQQALVEPLAWAAGLDLVGAAWRHAELRGYWQEWQQLLAQGLTVSRQAGRADFEALLLDQLGEASRLAGDNRGAAAHFQASLALFRALEQPAGAGRALSHLSQVQLALNDWAAAASSCQEAAAIFQALQRPESLGLVYNNWGLVCQEQEQLDEALLHFEQAAAAFRSAGNLRGEAKALVNRSDVLRRRQAWPEAEGYLRAGIALYDQLGDPLHSASTQMNLGILLFETGRPAEALALSLEAEEVFRRLRHRPFLARICNNHGIFLAALGRLAEAQEAFDESARLHLENGDQLYAASALINGAEVLLDQQRGAEASAHLAQANSLLSGLTRPPRWVMKDFQAQEARLEGLAGTQHGA